MRNLCILSLAVALLSGCAISTAVETGKAPTPTELQAQLAADMAALKAAGCIVEEGAQIAAVADPNGQRVAQVKNVSGAVCAAPSTPVASTSSP